MLQHLSKTDGRQQAQNPAAAPVPLLTVSDLTVTAQSDHGTQRKILQDISFSVAVGEVVGILGESGAGKTTLARALLRLLPAGFRFLRGAIVFHGKPLLAMEKEELRSVRGNQISLIFQDSSALNPVLRVEDQVAEVVRAHRAWNKPQCHAEARSMLAVVGFDEERLFSAYPHQLSGGQKRRVAIAQALVCGPDLLIADEPTVSLDAVAAREILGLLRRLTQERKMAVVLISHQPEVLTQLADRIIVLYGGRLIEEGSSHMVVHAALHPYTQALLACQFPNATAARRESKPTWPFIPGVTNASDVRGCVFERRCARRRNICREAVPAVSLVRNLHSVRCFEYPQEGACTT